MNKSSILYKGDNNFAYVDFGDPKGFPIFIQHGMIASIEDVELFENLAHNHFRLISVARPGYGESSPYEMHNLAEWGEMLDPLVDELGLKQFDILGISSGAPYSYALGFHFPEKARNIYILSGTPALYDGQVLTAWPYPTQRNQSLAELQKLAKELFFHNLSEEDLQKKDLRDSAAHHYFGVAQDLRLRGIDWGFSLPEVKANVFMRHSQRDDSVPFQTAIRTAQLLPNCELELTDTGAHFSEEILDDFIQKTILPTLSAGS